MPANAGTRRDRARLAAVVAVAAVFLLLIGRLTHGFQPRSTSLTSTATGSVPATTVPAPSPVVSRVKVDPTGGLVFDGRWLWAADQNLGQLVQIDPTSGRVVRQLRDPAQQPRPPGLSVAGGLVWAYAPDSSLAIDPHSGRVLYRLADTVIPAWVGDRSGVWTLRTCPTPACAGLLLRHVDPRSGRVLATVSVPGSGYTAQIGFGAAWVLGNHPADLWRVDLRTLTVKKIPPPAGDTRIPGFAVGSAGVWRWSDHPALERLDPQSGEVNETIPVPALVTAAASDGNQLWAVGVDGTLMGVDIAKRRVSALTAENFVNYNAAIAVTPGAVWVAHGSLARLNPRLVPAA